MLVVFVLSCLRSTFVLQNVKDFSDVAHRVKLLSQCNSFRQLISKIAAGRENFLVDLVKALKKVTDEWKNWKHQTYGKLQTRAYVSAIEQVCLLSMVS